MAGIDIAGEVVVTVLVASQKVLLLLQRWTIPTTVGRANTEGVLAVGQPDAAVPNMAVESIAVQGAQSLRSITHGFKL